MRKSRIYGAGLVLSETELEKAVEILDNHEGDDVPDGIEIWQPFENYELDDIMEMIDDNEAYFDRFAEEVKKDISHREELEKKGYCLGTIWQVSDVQDRYDCDEETAREIMDATLSNESVMNSIWESMEIIAEDEFGVTKKTK